jgi:hypothetical protein
MNDAIHGLSAREKLLHERLSKLHTEYETMRKCISATQGMQARMGELVLQGEQAVEVLLEYIEWNKERSSS